VFGPRYRDLGQHGRHHPVEQLRIAPEDMECLIEQFALVATVYEHRVQCPVEVVARTETDRFDRPDGIDDAARSDWQDGSAKHPAKQHDVVDDATVGHRAPACRARSARTWSRSTAASLPRIFAMSSWYLSRTPSVSSIAPGSSATLSSWISASVQ